MTCRLRLIVPLIAAAALLAGCGAELERAGSTSDPNALLRETFANVDQLRSGTIDLKLRVEPRGAAGSEGPLSARLQGPFVTEKAGTLPKFDLGLSLQSNGKTMTSGATWTGEKGYVDLKGKSYELSPLLTRQIEAAYEQAHQNRSGGGLVLGVDFSKWLSEARNQGAARVGDADTIKITGAANVRQVVADLTKIGQRAQALAGPALGAGAQVFSPAGQKAAADSIRSLTLDVYTGAEDRILRRLVVKADLHDVRSKGEGAVVLDLTFTKVGSDQDISAPKNPRPFSELLKQADLASLLTG